MKMCSKHVVFVTVQLKLEKAFTQEVNTCNYCSELLATEDKDNLKILIIWTENKKYRVFANLHRSLVDRIFRYEKIKNKSGKISQEIIQNHVNACDSFIKDIKDSLWVALHLRNSIY